MNSEKKAKLLVSLLICQLVGLLGSIFSAADIKEWYPTLFKPAFNPPNWIFAPVWTTLFVMMGVALYLVWTKKYSGQKFSAYFAFGIQLVFNLFWSVIFFWLHNPAFAFVDIIVLALSIIYTIVVFSKISKEAAYLLVPYLLWVIFAATLNFNIWILNM